MSDELTHVNAPITSPIPVWTAIQAQPSPEERGVEVERQLAVILRQFQTISITELMLNRERGGQAFIQLLDMRQKEQEYSGPKQVGKWRLRKIVNPDGSKPEPGDEFFYQVGTKKTFIDATGKRAPMNNKQLEIMLRRNRERNDPNDPYYWDEYELDEDCCIDCDYFQAMTIMTNFSDMSDHGEIVGPEFGEVGRYYWLFEEVLPTV